MTLIRQAITDLNDLTRLSQIDLVDAMVAYYARQTDKSTIRSAIKARYGYGIKKVDDGVESGTTIETYAREGFSEQVDAGMIEAISSGFSPKIVNALATLYTERTQKYTYTHETAEDTEPAETLLNKHREFGGYNATLTAADKLSIQAGSSAVLVSFTRDHLHYQKFSPADISVYFGDYIIEDDVERLVNMSDLNDATAVRIRLSQYDATTWNYLLILARSDLWPQGRHVTFRADSTGGNIPAIGEEGVFDWYPEGSSEVANPLSYFAAQNPEEIDLPEFPLSILYGGTTQSGDVMPVSTSLYTDCLEMDVATSHLLSTSQEAAAGTLVIVRDVTGRSAPLPTQLTGKVALAPGLSIERVDSNSTASIDGVQALKDFQVAIASGYGVPDYMAVSEDHMLEAASGISLQIKTKPLKQVRADRVELNKPFMRNVFAIEKILIDLHSTDNNSPEFALLKECEQEWDAGELEIPENKKEKTERIQVARDAGFIDEIEAIRQANGFVTDEEAIEFYDKMKKRAKTYPKINKEEPIKPVPGLQGRLQPGGIPRSNVNAR